MLSFISRKVGAIALRKLELDTVGKTVIPRARVI